MFDFDSEWDETTASIYAKLEKESQRETRFGPCEDDIEVCAPFIGVLPDESNREDGGPLNFGSEHHTLEQPFSCRTVFSAKGLTGNSELHRQHARRIKAAKVAARKAAQRNA